MTSFEASRFFVHVIDILDLGYEIMGPVQFQNDWLDPLCKFLTQYTDLTWFPERIETEIYFDTRPFNKLRIPPICCTLPKQRFLPTIRNFFGPDMVLEDSSSFALHIYSTGICLLTADCIFNSNNPKTPSQIHEATVGCFDPKHFDLLWQEPLQSVSQEIGKNRSQLPFQLAQKSFALYKPDPWWSSFWVMGFITSEANLRNPHAIATECAEIFLQTPRDILPYHSDFYLSVGFDYAILICTANQIQSRAGFLKLFQFMMHAWYNLHYLDQFLSSRIPGLMEREFTSIPDLDSRISEIKNLRNKIQHAFDWADFLTFTIWAEYVDILLAIRKSWLMDRIEENIARKIDNIDRIYIQSRDEIMQRQNVAQTQTLLFLSFLSLVSILAVAAQVFGFLDFNPTAPFLSFFRRIAVVTGTLFLILSVLLIARWKRWIGLGKQ